MTKAKQKTRKTSATKLTPSGLTYGEYIISDEWRDKHAKWLKQAGHRCMMLGVKIGNIDGKYHPYNFHHTLEGYHHLGQEELGRDVLALSPFAHIWIIHGGRKAGHDWKPNALQVTLHCWCRLNGFQKWCLRTLFLCVLILIVMPSH